MKAFISIFTSSFLILSSLTAGLQKPRQLQEQMEVGHKMLYVRADQSTPLFNIDSLALYDEAFLEFETLIEDILDENRIKEFYTYNKEFLKRGTCLGQALQFLLSKGKNKGQPLTLQEQREVVLYQLFDNVREFVKMNTHGRYSSDVELASNQELEDFIRLADFLQFSEVYFKEKYKSANLKVYDQLSILKREGRSDADFAEDFLEYLVAQCTKRYLLVSFGHSRENQADGHVILIALKDKLIFDAQYGIYSYEQLRDLIPDILKICSSILKTDIIWIKAIE